MNRTGIIVDNTNQELFAAMEELPVSMDEQHIAGSELPRHWHYEIQISEVTSESPVVFETETESCTVRRGEAVFLNSGVMHRTSAPDAPASYRSVNFRPEILYGSADSSIRPNCVDPVLFCEEMKLLKLDRTDGWQSEIRILFSELTRVYEERLFGYELQIKTILCRIWLLLLLNNRESIRRTPVHSLSEKNRLNQVTEFIHENYMRKISLEEIAGAANISRGECCRLVQRTLHTTPILYLKRYRLSKSLKLLALTDQSISEVANAVGFATNSYFTECFKKEIGCTPLEYRYQMKKAEQG